MRLERGIRNRQWWGVVFALCGMVLGSGVDADPGAASTPLKSPVALTLLPSHILLTGAHATQQLVVEVQSGGRYVGDRSAQAIYLSSDPHIAKVDLNGQVWPVREGTAIITAWVHGLSATATVRVEGLRTTPVWSFRNHVLPVLTRVGCNSGACHGAAAGKGGLKLSLRGFDPDSDYAVLTHQADGRRVIAGDPEESLLILKPTLTLPHGGGRRIAKGSREQQILAGWIRSGAPPPKAQDTRLARLELFPETAVLHPGDLQHILVRADYTDGHQEDVTRWVKFGTTDSTVATVNDSGKAKVMGYGDAAITVWFSSKVAYARLVSPYPDRPNAPQGDAARANFIDDLVLKKLHALNIPASPLCSDSAFLRRASLDAAGILPTPQETEQFLADTRPDKRARFVDQLLARPEFVDYWTYKWCDLLLVSSKNLPAESMNAFYTYIHKSVDDNKPWNTFVREIVTARGSTLDNGAAGYFVMHKDPIDLTETTTQAFLGMALTCARCHNHPLEKWTQRDYYQMANLFARVRLKNGDRGGEVLVLNAESGDINHPRLGVPLPPRPLDGREMALDDPADRRQHLADWLTSAENPYFARAIVNRVWRNFMGRGLVEAEDDLRLTNPPSNPELQDALTQDFVRNGYNIKRLIRTILLSTSYQRSADTVEVNVHDDRYYSHYIVRRLPAEVILDALSQVTGVPTEFADIPKGTRALQLHDSQTASYFLTAFGRPPREKTCACERQQEPNVAQALHLVNGDTINKKLQAAGSLTERLAKDHVADADALRRLYLAALCRYPTEAESRRALAVLAQYAPDKNATPMQREAARRAELEDLFWAVLTDREFLFNH